MVEAISMHSGQDRRGPAAYPVGERGPEIGKNGLQQEEHQGVANRLDRRRVKPLHDVGRQEQRHAPVADRVGGVDQPAGDQASPNAGQPPSRRLRGSAGAYVDVAMRLGDALPDQEQDDGGDDGDDERRLPAEPRHERQRDPGGEHVAQREQRKDHAANADRAGLGGPHLGGVRRADGKFPGPPTPVKNRSPVKAAMFVVSPARAVVTPYSRIDAPSVVLRPHRSAARPKPIVPIV